MKYTLALSIFALAASTSAQYYNETSAPFYLVVTSADETKNSTLSTCHTGAALESLCLSNSNTSSKPNPSPPSTFAFNTSSSSFTPNTTLGTPGILTWFLPTNAGNIPSSVQFSYDPTTDIVVPILAPGEDRAQILAFDEKNMLNVQGYVDWSANPPSASGETRAYYRWYACTTYYAGYVYENLVWGLGTNGVENPTCVSVGVRRVFV